MIIFRAFDPRGAATRMGSRPFVGGGTYSNETHPQKIPQL